MENKPKRPASVWIAQILLAIFILIFLLPLVMVLLLPVGTGSISIIGIAIMMLLYFGVTTLLIASFWGMACRRPYGRWLGLAELSLLFVFSILGQMMTPPGPVPYAEYENTTQAIAGTVTQLVMCGLFLFVLVHLAFAKSVTAFFSYRTDARLPDTSLPPTDIADGQ